MKKSRSLNYGNYWKESNIQWDQWNTEDLFSNIVSCILRHWMHNSKMHNSNAYFYLAACQCQSLLKPIVLLWGVLFVWHMDSDHFGVKINMTSSCISWNSNHWMLFLMVVDWTNSLSDHHNTVIRTSLRHFKCVLCFLSVVFDPYHDLKSVASNEPYYRCPKGVFRMCMFIHMCACMIASISLSARFPAFIACAYSRLSPRMRDSNRWNWFHTAGTSPGQSNYEL